VYMSGEPRNLKDKTVLITGGGSGVGFECAKLFSAHKAKIIITGRSENKLAAACKKIGDAASYVVCDVGSSKTVNTVFTLPIHILINNAGTILRKTAHQTTDEEWEKVIKTNVTGVFNCSRAFAKQDIIDGSIVNVSSTCGQVGAAGLAAYCASKGAVNQLTRTMALELAPRCITVNAVAPGAINSPMLFSKHGDSKLADTAIERNLDSIPIGTVAAPEDVARSILFLACERHITGTILSVDGGYTAQ